MINQDDVQAAGGDWAGYGELSGQQLIALMQEGKLSVVFANNAVVMAVTNMAGESGTYVLPHVKDIANFA